MLRTSASFVVSFFLLLIPVYAVIPASVGAITACPQKGEVPITDRARARIAGIPDTAPCWNPNDPNIGTDVSEAKTYLRSILCKPDGDNFGGKGADGTIADLNPKFAQCAAKFLKEVSGQLGGQKPLLNGGGGSVCIKEGARTVERQNAYVRRGVIACKKGAACEHPRGIAIDVNTTSSANYQTLHQKAKDYGVIFYLGFQDKYHFVPRTAECSTAGFRPNDSSGSVGAPPSSSPSANFSNVIRSALGQQPMLPPQPPLPQQPLAQMQPISSAFSQPMPGVTPTTGSEAIGGVSGQLTGGAAGTSSADILEQLAFGTRATSTQGATSTFGVVINGNDVGGIGTGQRSATTSSTPARTGTAPTQNTFVTNDLSFQATSAFGGEQSSFIRILESIRLTLLQMLQYLKPFGGVQPIAPGE
ncbi:MAG: hypothetical protein AAB734_03530 [Patescibacteria group bacterium]